MLYTVSFVRNILDGIFLQDASVRKRLVVITFKYSYKKYLSVNSPNMCQRDTLLAYIRSMEPMATFIVHYLLVVMM